MLHRLKKRNIKFQEIRERKKAAGKRAREIAPTTPRAERMK